MDVPRRSGALVGALLLATAACECTVEDERPGGGAETAGNEQAGPPSEQLAAPAPEEGCAANTPIILTSSGAPRGPIAVAISGQRALVAHPAGDDALELWPTEPTGAPLGEPSTLTIPHARELMAFEAVGPRFVAMTGGECPDAVEGGRCFFARAVDADGQAIGADAVVPVGELRSMRARASDGALYVAHSTVAGATALDRFAVDATGVAHRRTELGAGRDLEGEHVEVLGLAVHEDRWAVIWRAGATENAASDVLVTTPEGEWETESLHHALVIERARLSEEGLAAIAAFEFSRPKLVRLSAGGETVAEEELGAGAPVPAPFADALSAGVRYADGVLALVLRNGAGDRVETVEVLRSPDPSVPHRADVTRSGNGFLLAFTGPEANGHAIGTARVQCASRLR